ncbi:DoxX family protein [Paenibacillus silviterrae]|uniref:DoxX family protein n=1 Tax=Paenibacillus silviterrae TaxID=3242194 RepID=UPI0025427C02|nr:DoxX family protein [Paenibacillus chinjuensis]
MNFIIPAQAILAGMFMLSILMKFGRNKSMLQHWNDYRYPLWFMYVTASLELCGALGLILAFWVPAVLKIAAALLAVLMIGAIHAHLFRAKHRPVMAINALLMLSLSAFLCSAKKKDAACPDKLRLAS